MILIWLCWDTIGNEASIPFNSYNNVPTKQSYSLLFLLPVCAWHIRSILVDSSLSSDVWKCWWFMSCCSSQSLFLFISCCGLIHQQVSSTVSIILYGWITFVFLSWIINNNFCTGCDVSVYGGIQEWSLMVIYWWWRHHGHLTPHLCSSIYTQTWPEMTDDYSSCSWWLHTFILTFWKNMCLVVVPFNLDGEMNSNLKSWGQVVVLVIVRIFYPMTI